MKLCPIGSKQYHPSAFKLKQPVAYTTSWSRPRGWSARRRSRNVQNGWLLMRWSPIFTCSTGWGVVLQFGVDFAQELLMERENQMDLRWAAKDRTTINEGTTRICSVGPPPKCDTVRVYHMCTVNKATFQQSTYLIIHSSQCWLLIRSFYFLCRLGHYLLKVFTGTVFSRILLQQTNLVQAIPTGRARRHKKRIASLHLCLACSRLILYKPRP